MATRTRTRDVPVTREIAPGVRLHLLRTDRFTTSFCRVALHRDLGAEATATALLAQVLQSATRRHPSREALGHRLGDLYGAALHVSVGKLGDRQLLVGSLEWPTAHVPRAGRLLAEGLELLREVWSEPLRTTVDGEEALDPDIVRTEQVNHVRALRSRRNDKARYAVARCLETICADEPYGLDAQGREEDVKAADPVTLARLHRRLIRTAPIEIYFVGNLGLREATAAIRRHLLWPERSTRVRRVPRVGSVRAARNRPKRIVEDDAVTQGKLVMGLRAPIRGGTAAGVAAETLAGVLGGGSYGRLFKIVREEHGLCYYATAGWHRPKGVLLIHTGIDPANEAAARRLILKLSREVAGGVLEASALEGYRQDIAHRVAALEDSPRAMVGWLQERLALGLDPSPRSFLDQVMRVTPAAVRRAGSRLALDSTFYLRPQAAAGEVR
ncbi:MAG: insulinase family protein [Planctomycetota bacterium]|nr:insulinase family protein [Planctomycetota bacterium]